MFVILSIVFAQTVKDSTEANIAKGIVANKRLNIFSDSIKGNLGIGNDPGISPTRSIFQFKWTDKAVTITIAIKRLGTF